MYVRNFLDKFSKKKTPFTDQDSSTHLSPINPGDEPWKVWQSAIRANNSGSCVLPAAFTVINGEEFTLIPGTPSCEGCE